MLLSTRTSRLIVLTTCTLLLSILFAACSIGGSTTSSSSPAPAAPVATQPAATAATSSTPASSASTSLQTFSGNGYSVGYPAGWTVTPGDNKLTITDPSGNYVFLLQVTPNTSGASTDALMSAAVKSIQGSMTSIQQNNIDQQVSLAGETWNQASFDGDVQGTRITYRVLITNHQFNGVTSAYLLSYGAPRDKVDQLETSDFLPMLNSFTFS